MKSTKIYQQWIDAKEAERQAVELRRELEDKMTEYFALAPDLDGTETFDRGDYVVKVVGRLNHKVDGEAVQEIAQANGLTDYISMLFRFKPELNISNWKKSSVEITKIFAPAITTTPGRPSYSIEKKSEEA